MCVFSPHAQEHCLTHRLTCRNCAKVSLLNMKCLHGFIDIFPQAFCTACHAEPYHMGFDCQVWPLYIFLQCLHSFDKLLSLRRRQSHTHIHAHISIHIYISIFQSWLAFQSSPKCRFCESDLANADSQADLEVKQSEPEPEAILVVSSVSN